MPASHDSALLEHDAMQCRSCGHEERASEGYPCASCGTFICLMCVFKGVVRCAACERESRTAAPAGGGESRPTPSSSTSVPPAPLADWPDH